jgi:hypothetical protein
VSAATVPYGRPGTKAARVRRLVHEHLNEHAADDAIPTSARFVFYELEQRGDARKPASDDRRPNKRRSHGWPPGEQDLIDALTWLRQQAVVPWGWIVDETRSLASWQHAPSVIDYLSDRLAEATLNPWGDGPPPLILCESRATAGVLERTASEYVCPIAGTAGQVGGFLWTVVAPLLRETGGGVLYLGDLDKQGIDIEVNTRRVLERACGCGLDWRRLGMTAEQAEEIEPIWKVDGRNGEGHWAWEVEALGQAGVLQLVREALAALLPEPLDRVQEREAVQRKAVAIFLATWNGG